MKNIILFLFFTAIFIATTCTRDDIQEWCETHQRWEVLDEFCDQYDNPPIEMSMAQQLVNCGGIGNNAGVPWERTNMTPTVTYFRYKETNNVNIYEQLYKFIEYRNFNADTIYVATAEGDTIGGINPIRVGKARYIVDEVNEVGSDSFHYVATQLRVTFGGYYNGSNAISEMTPTGDARKVVPECEDWAEVGDTLYLVYETIAG